MTRPLARFIYRYLIFPGIFMGAHILSVFSSPVRRGLFPRYHTLKQLAGWINKTQAGKKVVLIHAASLGEFEHIKPLLHHFKNDYLTTNVVMFFSPSGYLHVREHNFLDFYIYMPFDTRRSWKTLYRLLNPLMVIVAKHDVWPQQVWTARDMNIPVFLINASLAENSTRTRTLVKNFLSTVYNDFERIYPISEEDGKRFKEHYPGCRLGMTGDTKYDQVVLRKKAAEKQSLLPEHWYKDRFILVAGSTWPEDEEHLFPALRELLLKYKYLNLILIPHQPDEKALKSQKEFFKEWETCLFSARDELKEQRILITDAVGYLAGLYLYAQAAYVGGSFHQGVHNVMEPAIFGVPVLYGPEHRNSYEAIKLAENNGGVIVRNKEDLLRWLDVFIQDADLCKEFGEKAEDFARCNTGATNRLLAGWNEILSK